MRCAKSGLVRLLVRETHSLKDAMALADEIDVLPAIVADYGGVFEGFREVQKVCPIPGSYLRDFLGDQGLN